MNEAIKNTLITALVIAIFGMWVETVQAKSPYNLFWCMGMLILYFAYHFVSGMKTN